MESNLNQRHGMTSPGVSWAPSPSPIRSLVSNIKSPNESGGSHRSSSSQSAFTPVVPTSVPLLTPSGRNSSRLLLSPSQTISNSLTELASSASKQLEELWDEVGYVAEERASQIADLLVRLKDTCDTKISEEMGVVATFRKTNADLKEELKATSKALKIEPDPLLLRENTGQTLTDELATLEAGLEGLRSVAAAAKEDIKGCHDQLVEAHNALGIVMDEKWKDIDTDLTTSRRQEFHLKVSEIKEALSTRTSAVIQLLRDCQQLMKELHIDAEKEGSEFDKQIAGSLVRSKDGSFMMTSKFRTDSCTGISAAALDELTDRVAELSGEKRRRKAKLQQLGATISSLWEKLSIPEDEQRAFQETKVKGISMDTIESGESEVKRLLELKSEMMGKLVAEARERIVALWEETNTTAEHRQRFEPMKVHDEMLFDDDLLEQHEEYIHVLEARLERMKPIIKIIERREEILKERVQYENYQKNPERLQGRGANLTKQLMMEEKMARRIKKDLPKLTKALETKLREWMQSSNEDFLYHGEVYFEAIARQEEEWIQYKNKAKSMKNQVDQKNVENRFDSTSRYKPLPGKKNAVSVKHRAKGIASKPLTDVRNQETNSAPSHVRRR